MAKGEYLSRHQKGIVNRYYEHMDTIQLQRLSEMVSDLYLADSPKKVEQLWKRAESALTKALPRDPEVREVLASRDVEKLARVVSRLSASSGD
jgi:hypothetical protein